MAESKQNLFKIIIGVCAIIMCILFFVAPVLSSGYSGFFSGSNTGGYTAFNFATGTNRAQTFPVAFLLLFAPAALAILALIKRSFKILCGVSVICLIVQIIFVSVASNLASGGEELTGANWVFLTVYIGLCILTIVGIMKKETVSNISIEETKIKVQYTGFLGAKYQHILLIVAMVIGICGLIFTGISVFRIIPHLNKMPPGIMLRYIVPFVSLVLAVIFNFLALKNKKRTMKLAAGISYIIAVFGALFSIISSILCLVCFIEKREK